MGEECLGVGDSIVEVTEQFQADQAEDLGQLVVPLPRRNPDGTKAEPSSYLVQFLRDLVEVELVSDS